MQTSHAKSTVLLNDLGQAYFSIFSQQPIDIQCILTVQLSKLQFYIFFSTFQTDCFDAIGMKFTCPNYNETEMFGQYTECDPIPLSISDYATDLSCLPHAAPRGHPK